MNINISTHMLGDCILVEPAAAAWQRRRGRPVSVHVATRPYRALFGEGHFVLADAPHPAPDVVPDSTAAFWYAINNGLPFAAGYFPQLGLEIRQGDRLHYSSGLFHRPDRHAPYACVCPNARSDVSHHEPGRERNIEATPEWWAPVVAACPMPVYTLGAAGDMVLPGTAPAHGLPLSAVMRLMAGATLVISVETGLLHAAGGIAGLPVIFLSSATPPGFADPKGSLVVRARTPAEFDPEEAIEHMHTIIDRRT